jgi:soluble lytic murein transglycosylase-like protein
MEILMTAQEFANAKNRLVPMARMRALQYSLDPILVCGVIEKESGWNQWAYNPEPRYRYFWNVQARTPFRKVTDAEIAGKVPPQDFPAYRGEDRDAEYWGQQASWGLMQIMGAVGRECGFAGIFLPQLCHEDIGLEYGCIHLVRKFEQAHGDVTRALLAWNGGADPTYPAKVQALMGGYR